jgi:uncharacterized damage-inducible protein DinB
MKEFFVMFAQYNKDADRTIYAILSKLSNDQREKERGSYYKTLSGLFTHVLFGSKFFAGMFQGALAGKNAPLKALEGIAALEIPKGVLSEDAWKKLGAVQEALDDALINMVLTLDENDLNLPVKIEWFGGKPAEVPLSFMLSQLIAHGTHHRGQVSQILDELGIDNNYSGINVAFLPK